MATVTQAVEALVRATVGLSDAEMGRPWVWREYDDEGLRFALLMAQHELRDLAVRLAAAARATVAGAAHPRSVSPRLPRPHRRSRGLA